MHHGHPRSTNHVKSDLLRWILISVGWISIAGGVIGIFLPLVPTVPFLLLGAVCFSRSSEKFHGWLVDHKQLGPLLRDFLSGGGIPLRAKIMTIGMVWMSISATTFLVVRVFWVRGLLLAIGTGITLYLLSLPTASPINGAKETAAKQ